MLLRLQTIGSAWVPHPDVPAEWAVSDIAAFHRYVAPNEDVDSPVVHDAFNLALAWRAENASALQDRFATILDGTGIQLGARYHAYSGGQYVDLALVIPQTEADRLRIRSVWRGESTLAELVRAVFPDAVRQYTAPWLGSQRIDVFVPSHQLAFEYQGQQHYTAVAYFGGDEQLRATMERDDRKRAACAAARVRLIEWPYMHAVDADVLRAKLAAFGLDMPALPSE